MAFTRRIFTKEFRLNACQASFKLTPEKMN